ncbi:MAG: FAD-dependent oxidoreductase [Myxococcota bacterium]
MEALGVIPHRREVLAAFLGLPAAVAACRRGGDRIPAMPDGAFALRNELAGHRLRDMPALTPAAEDWERAMVVIVGGGAAGLAAAWRLARAGFDDFLVLELGSAAGGTSRAGHSALGGHPWGAHYITAPMRDNRATIAVLDEMSIFEGRDDAGRPIVAEHHMCRDPEERLFFRGRWYEDLYLYAGASADDLAQRRDFDAVLGYLSEWRDSRGRRAFALPSSQSSDDPEILALDRMTMAEWMDRQGFTSPRLRWYADYGCRDDYGLGLDHTSAWAGLFYYVARLERGADDYQPVVTWPEGNGRLISHLAERAGHRLRTGWTVCEIRQPGGSAAADADPGVGAGVDVAGRPPGPIEVLALTDGGTRVRGIRAERVIFAAPQFTAPYIVRDYRQHRPDHIAEFDYGPWLVANLTLRERPRGRGFPLAWDNVLYGSPALGYVVAAHQRGLDHGPVILTYYYPLLDSDSSAARRRLLSTSWAEWADVVLSDLERAHPDIRQLTERIDMVRWGHAMVRPRPGFRSGRARHAAAVPYRGIHFAHSDLSGVSLFDEALDHGVRAAEEILAAYHLPYRTAR